MGNLTTGGNNRVGIILVHDDGATVFPRYANRRAILRPPKNHRFSKCDIVQKFRGETRAHEKLVLLLEAHHHEQRVSTRHHTGGLFGRFETKINSVSFRTFKKFDRPVSLWPNHDDLEVLRRLLDPDDVVERPSEPADRGGTAWLTPPDPVAVQGNDALILEEGFAAPAEPPAPSAPLPPPSPPPLSRARYAPPTLRRPGRSRRRVWLALFVLVAGAAGAVVYSRAPVFLALGVRIPALVRQALKALPPQTWRSHTAARLPAPSPAAPRRSAPPSSRPPVRLSPPVEQPGAAVAQAVRSYNEEAALFNTQHDCTELARSLRAVEDRWIAYTRRHSPGATLDAARARRDQAVYASVDSVERRFEASGCPRRP